MSMENSPPVVKVEIEYMRQTLLAAITARESEIAKVASEQVNKALDQFDFGKVAEPIVKAAVERAISDIVHRALYPKDWTKRDEIVDRLSRSYRMEILRALAEAADGVGENSTKGGSDG